MKRLALAALVVFSACGPKLDHSRANGEGCTDDGQCQSGHCMSSYCSQCATADDCGEGFVCGKPPRTLGAPGGPTCVSVDAGCASPTSECPSGFSCSTCPSGYACHDATGECYSVTPPPPQVCGEADFSDGYDAGWGPGPDVTNAICYSCIGCPLGSTCLCGASGVVGGLRCDDDSGGAALACFVSGGAGYCQVFPGDCATNAQCASTPGTPLCSRSGRCVACLRDLDCPQGDAGSNGCIDGTCYPCCATDAMCPADTRCVSGFCYSCEAVDGGCTPGDGGADGGFDAGGDAGSDDAGTTDAGDAG